MKAIFVTPKIISQKCRYALRAIFELASRENSDVMKISEIAAAPVSYTHLTLPTILRV